MNTNTKQPGHEARNYPRSEIRAALVWLSVFALMSVLVEVSYLPLEIRGFPVPLAHLLAFGFTMVLTKTARLWSPALLIAATPLLAWLAGFFLFFYAVDVTSMIMQSEPARAWALLIAGLTGGGWPLAAKK
ncbi:hypothetical protein [Corynebacterium aquatimens]|uniref:Glucan phosphoethanolaminetransferase (Alkaline phosphatase superfamily) n=1 Tax=Corynebacterium aquatimens TaxID=1190508 RepID=A0A931GSW8_9CORY|nr:hypothetical protein [Corynebacterium aquatimens]MBG6121275.1 glucan phosphoethanolaminetransferase (alkaline phosphatase superfamily) [Corynebacterium aquatimens]WJY66175.1 hypothetical protein CAQUA_07395 [Corynebacterium aquatimens]